MANGNIQFTGQNVEITPALKEFTTKKFERLRRHTDKMTSIHVTFSINKLQQMAEANIHVPGAEIHARSESENMYKTIDSLVDKLTRQLTRHKEKITNHHKD